MIQFKVFNLNVVANLPEDFEKNVAIVEKQINEFIRTHALPKGAIQMLENGIVVIRYIDYTLQESEGLSVFDQISLVDVKLSEMMNNRIAHEAEYRFLMSIILQDPSEKNTTAQEAVRKDVAEAVQNIRVLRDFRKDLVEGNWNAFTMPEYLQDRRHSGMKILKPGEEGYNSEKPQE